MAVNVFTRSACWSVCYSNLAATLPRITLAAQDLWV